MSNCAHVCFSCQIAGLRRCPAAKGTLLPLVEAERVSHEAELQKIREWLRENPEPRWGAG